MLVKMGKSARECYQHAADAHNRAAMADDVSVREFYTKMENSWLTLAQSYEYNERLDRFCDEHGVRLNADK